MSRSIRLFERALFVALGLDLANNFASWPRFADALTARGFPPNPLFMFLSCTMSAIVGLALWYFIVRRRSVVAKWLYTILVALAVMGYLYTFTRPIAPGGATILAVAAVAELLKIFAATRLFTADAAAYLSTKRVA